MEFMLLGTYPVDNDLIEIMKNKFSEDGEVAEGYSDGAKKLLARIL